MANAPSGVQGQSPVGGPGGKAPGWKQKEFNVLTLLKITFPYLFSISFEVDSW